MTDKVQRYGQNEWRMIIPVHDGNFILHSDYAKLETALTSERERSARLIEKTNNQRMKLHAITGKNKWFKSENAKVNDSRISLAMKAERALADTKSLHADIIDQGRKVQIAASGESKYGAMSDSDFIEWVLGKLEGKDGN